MTSPVLGAEQLAQLHGRFHEYSQGSHYRTNALSIRSRAHALIRDLTASDNLPKLSLDDFDERVWRLGNMRTKREIFSRQRARQFQFETSPDRFAAMLDSGELRFVGNMTWGSAVKTLRAYARDRSDKEIEIRMRQAVGLLLHQPGALESRLRQVSDLAIGFGRNVSSGLLMIWHPREFILYNSKSEDCWAAYGLDFSTGDNWVKPYLRYNAFCRTLLGDPVINLHDLVDLDVFVNWHSIRYSIYRKKTRSTRKARGRKLEATRPDITFEQLKVTKQEMPPEKFRATWGALYDKLRAEELSKLTSDITAAELGQRARRRVDEVHAFLHGQTAGTPSAEALCDWIQFCYALELYREASALSTYVREDEVDAAIYRRAKRVAEVCRGKLHG
jgi:hypothetical protein